MYLSLLCELQTYNWINGMLPPYRPFVRLEAGGIILTLVAFIGKKYFPEQSSQERDEFLLCEKLKLMHLWFPNSPELFWKYAV